MQIVPNAVHGISHSGVASGIRAGTLRAGGFLLRGAAVGLIVVDPVSVIVGPVTAFFDGTYDGAIARAESIVAYPEGHDTAAVQNAHEWLRTGMQIGTPEIPSDSWDKLTDYLNGQSFGAGCSVNTPAIK